MGKCPVCKKEDDFVIVDEDGFCIHYKKQLNQDEIEDQKTDLKLQEISKDVEELKEYSDKFIALNESWQRGYDYARELKGEKELKYSAIEKVWDNDEDEHWNER